MDANPQAHEHARMRYRRANLRFERDLIETFAEPADAVVFLQTIEHLQDPGTALEHFRGLVGDGGMVYLSTPNVLTLAPKGAPRSDNPWHVHEYRARRVRAAVPRALRLGGALRSLPRPQAARARARAAAGLGRVHPRLGLTERFYDWFTPAISAADFALRPRGQADLDEALDFVAVCRA